MDRFSDLSRSGGGAFPRRLGAVLAALALVIAAGPTAAAADSPTLWVDPDADLVTGQGWDPGAAITVTDPTSSKVLGTATADGSGLFTVESAAPIRAGTAVQAAGGGDTLDVTATALGVRAVDMVADTVSGTATRNTDVHVEVAGTTGESVVTTGRTGTWLATAAELGDVVVGTNGWVTQYETSAHTTGTRIAWTAFNPVFRVAPTTEDEGAGVHSATVGDRLGSGYQWPAETDLTVVVTSGGALAGTYGATTDAAGEFAVGPISDIDITAGDEVTVTTGEVDATGTILEPDAAITKTLEVSALAVTAVQADTDTVTGTAAPVPETAEHGTAVYVQPTLSDDPVGCTVYADRVTGAWTAAFTGAGPCPAYDLATAGPGSMGYAAEADHDLDATHVSWHLWAPNIQVDAQRDLVEGVHWSDVAGLAVNADGHTEVEVEVSRDGATLGTWPAVADRREASFVVDAGESGVDVRPGDLVTATATTDDPSRWSGATLVKEHTVLDLTIADVDDADDLVSGTIRDANGAPSDGEVLVVVYDDTGNEQRLAPVLLVPKKDAGSWTADFGAVGTTLGSTEGTFDITAATTIEVGQGDEDGDSTAARRPGIPFEVMFVDPAADAVFGHHWAPDTDVTITTDGPDGTAATARTDGDGWFWTDLGEAGVDLTAGRTVVVTDGTATKDHTVTDLGITAVDTATDTVSGTATRKVPLVVGVYDDAGGTAVDRRLTPRTTWQVSFEGAYDIEAGTTGFASQSDGDGDATWTDWPVAPPGPDPEPSSGLFSVDPLTEVVWGGEWAPEAEVTVTVAGTPVATAGTDGDGWFWTDLGGVVDVAPGDTVTVTDGTTTKEHVVTALAVTAVDAEADTVAGTTDSDGPLTIGIWTADGQSSAEVALDGSATWTADFAGLFDILGDTTGYAGQSDADGDATWVDWTVPAPPP